MNGIPNGRSLQVPLSGGLVVSIYDMTHDVGGFMNLPESTTTVMNPGATKTKNNRHLGYWWLVATKTRNAGKPTHPETRPALLLPPARLPQPRPVEFTQAEQWVLWGKKAPADLRYLDRILHPGFLSYFHSMTN